MDASQKLNGKTFAKMMHGALANLQLHAREVNDLNVFPIPDGDTGDNMLLTLTGGVNAVGDGSESLFKAARNVSDGMLLGARGNSGVILSQIFEGFANGLVGVDEANADDITAALSNAVRHSYGAVMEPTEGTLLTVMRCAVEKISSNKFSDLQSLLWELIGEAKLTLEKTPDMLAVLKKAGVVDSGGAGLVYILEGMSKAADGTFESSEVGAASDTASSEIDMDLFTEDSELEFGYCTELLLRLQRRKVDIESFEISSMTDYLSGIGDSVVAFKNGSIVKLHVHTKTPDRVLAFCQRYGEFLKVKIENMSLQHNNTSAAKAEVRESSSKSGAERKKYGVVAVGSGDGIKEMFSERGADVIVDGGQSMNPSAEDFIKAFDRAVADTIFVLPNNSNVTASAKQAAGMYASSDVRVIESRSIGDGYAALSMLSFESGNADLIASEMTEAMSGVMTAEISRSVRDADGVRAGDYIGFVGKDILSADRSRYRSACATVEKLFTDDFEVCIVIRGREADKSEADALFEYIKAENPSKEVYLIDGKQDIYDYILIFE